MLNPEDAKKDSASKREASPTSTRSKRQKKNRNLINNNKSTYEAASSVRSKRQKKNDITDGGSNSTRQKRTKKPPTIVGSLENLEKVQGEKSDAPPKDDNNHLCSDTIGYGPEFLDAWLEAPATIEFKVEPPNKAPVVKVSKTLIIYDVPNQLSTKIESGDILYKFNDLLLTTREEYIRQLQFVTANPDSQTLTYTILRPLKSKQIPEKELSDVFSKLQSPQGFEILPTHFDYLFVFLTIAPKTTLGVTIKGYNGKVYVSGIEKKVTSIAYKCLLVGDAILAIEDQALSGVKDTHELLCTSFAKKKFVRLIIERAKTADGLRNVKLALRIEKTFEINPRMNEDITNICEQQITFMKNYPELKPGRMIYRQHHSSSKSSTSHVDVAPESTELPITTDVNNLNLLAPTPPVPAVPPGTVGFFFPVPVLVESASKRMLKKRTTK
uniref:PDZ domain-containing protein n=1 Tax=Panagrolaimus sp. PS1159 TaxID=55785 RepID=A0AC35FBX1_9BILA